MSPFPPQPNSAAEPWRVEPVTAAHAPALERCLGDPEVAARFGLRRALTAAQVSERVRQFVEGWAQGYGYAFALVGAGDGSPVGACHLGVVGREPLVGQLGYFIARPCWGRGLATRLVGRVVQLAFGELRFQRLEALARADNAASLRVLARLGFRAVAEPAGPPAPWCRHLELARHHTEDEAPAWRT